MAEQGIPSLRPERLKTYNGDSHLINPFVHFGNS